MELTGRVFKKSIEHSYSYQRIVSESFKATTIQAETDKVTNTVGTF
jgi:hypothetical protein